MHLDFQIHWRRTMTIGMTMVVTSISAVLFIVATSSIPLLGKRSKKYELGPTTLLWRVGVGESRNSQNLLETITLGKLGSRDIWRVTHYSQTPERFNTDEYDFYDLDRDSLAPIQGISRHENERLEITFSSAAVTVRSSVDGGTDRVEEVSLDGPVKPEGPGLTPWVATLPLTEGYKLDYQIVDRWKDLRGMPSDDLLEKNEAEYEKLFDEFDKTYGNTSLVNGDLPICHQVVLCGSGWS